MWRRFAGVVVLALVGLAGATPAHAASYIKVCNFSGSDDNILVYNDSTRQEWQIGPGWCRSDINDAGGDARVDVDPSGGLADIDSWKKKGSATNSVWTECYSGENGASNPYSGSGAWTTYWTYQNTACA